MLKIELEAELLKAESRIAQLEEENKQLKRQLHPSCTCERCTGIPSVESYYKDA